VNILTRPEFRAFCEARGIRPTKDTERAKAWRVPPVEVGERKPAQFVMRHEMRAEGPSNAVQYTEGGEWYETGHPRAEVYTLHPTTTSAVLFESGIGYGWEPNPAPVRAAFRANLEAWNPAPEQKED
jgi:hypothetical protein